MGRPRFVTFVIPGIIPAALAVLALQAGGPPASLIAIIAIAYVLILGVYFSERIAAPIALVRGAEAMARNAWAIGISLTRRVQYRGDRKILKITSRSGICPLGLDAGATWEINESGRLNRSVCRPAALAMGLALEGGDPRAQQACVCPRGPQNVSFSVQ
ncbi:MAG: hypothetical protein QF554_11760 [Dehalococcoidia bacterium]|jgi:hypothetical protein|nr:hypothetical protein [Dehalococcoidia bacterium]